LEDSFVKYQAYLIVFNSLDRIAYFKAKLRFRQNQQKNPWRQELPFYLNFFLKKVLE